MTKPTAMTLRPENHAEELQIIEDYRKKLEVKEGHTTKVAALCRIIREWATSP